MAQPARLERTFASGLFCVQDLRLASSLSKWLSLSGHERLLFLAAWMVLLSSRLVWRVVPLRWVWKLAGGSAGRPPHPPASADIERIRQAIDRASARVPGTTCLTRGFAAAILLRFAGRPHRMLIGVRKTGDSGFSAHAWVLSEGEIVTGNLPDLGSYIPLPLGAPIPPLRETSR
jgi:hypothetical protein